MFTERGPQPYPVQFLLTSCHHFYNNFNMLITYSPPPLQDPPTIIKTALGNSPDLTKLFASKERLSDLRLPYCVLA